MPTPIRLAALVGLGALAWVPIVLTAYVEGPFPGMTGGFGEPTCQKCHFDNTLNEPPGTLSVAGIPQSYLAGNRYPITMTLRRPEMERGGFEMSVRFARGRRAGQQAGTLTPADARRMQIIESENHKLHYIQHTKAGSRATVAGELKWIVEWRAPETEADPVVFHVAGNASNRDDSALGDYVYLTQRRS
ncbi:MAG: hypothetical protein HYZ58_05745, partial [Acidobacteria bacterium]|nr:hypothetical protein [Acidobacteriota bacterium]